MTKKTRQNIVKLFAITFIIAMIVSSFASALFYL